MLYFIVNPSSSSGKGLRIWKECAQILKQRSIAYRTLILRAPGDAAKAARKIEAMTPSTAVIVGGDGTINEFLTALTSFQGLTFAYIPTGSANDFARGMNLPSDPRKILERIIAGDHTRMVTIGVTSSDDRERSFAVSSGTGFDAAVCHASETSSPKKILNRLNLGKLIYLYNALRMLFSMKLFRMRVVTDDHVIHTYDKVCFAAVMNTKYEGGGFMFAPNADPCDDMLDLVIAEGIPKWKILLILPTAFSGNHVRFQGVHVISCSRAALYCEEEQCVHTDGEHFGYCRKVKYGIRPEKLRMII